MDQYRAECLAERGGDDGPRAKLKPPAHPSRRLRRRAGRRPGSAPLSHP
jgi:hypothetical protein